ncbi:MAG: hypothetical protein QM661_09725 [Solimonas sp.]
MAEYGLSNPYYRGNPIGAALSTAQQVIGLKNAIQQGQDAAEDRDATRQYRGLQMKQAQLGIDKSQREADDEQAKRDIIKSYYGGGTGVGMSSLGGSSAQQQPAPQAKQPNVAQTKDDLIRLGTIGEARVNAAGEHFDALADFATALQNGNGQQMQQAWPGVIDAYNDIHHDDIKTGVGEVRADGARIVDKKVVDFLSDDRGHVPVLSVTVEDKDGKRSSYEAPATVGRGSDPKSHVMFKSDDDLLGDFHGALETGLAVRSGQIKPGDALAAARQEWLSHGFDPDEFDKRIGTPKPTGTTRNVTKNGKPVVQERYSDGTWVDAEGVEPYEKPQQGVHTVGNALVDSTGKVLYRGPEDAKNRETFGNPTDEIDANGNPIRVQYGNRGTRQVVPGARPAPKASESTTGTNGKPLPAAVQKLEDDDLDALNIASGMQSDLQNFRQQISSGDLKLGPVANIESAVRNYAGMSDTHSQNYASFRSALEKMRNDSLRLNKGVQTEGDAQRAWNELFQNMNDPRVVDRRLQEISNINARAAKFRDARIQNRRKTYGREALDTSPFYADQSAYTEATPQQQPGTQASQQPARKDYSHLWGN